MWACSLDGALAHHFRACALVGAMYPPPFNVKVILGGHVKAIIGGHVKAINIGGHVSHFRGTREGHFCAVHVTSFPRMHTGWTCVDM